MKKKPSTDEMVKRLLAGDRRSAARLITLVENEMDDHHKVMGLVYPHTGQAMILGITGTGNKREYIESIIEQQNDPYSVVEEVLDTYLLPGE
jgi:putative protein kinase ArgK-like GTPase of G3E family